MAIGKLNLPDPTVLAFATGALNLSTDIMTAVLLADTYTPDLVSHATYADVSAHELNSGDYIAQAVDNQAVAVVADGFSFTSDTVDYGNPVDIPYCQYMAVIVGTVGALNAGDRLLGIVDLDEGGSPVRSLNAAFNVAPDASGWFTVKRS